MCYVEYYAYKIAQNNGVMDCAEEKKTETLTVLDHCGIIKCGTSDVGPSEDMMDISTWLDPPAMSTCRYVNHGPRCLGCIAATLQRIGTTVYVYTELPKD